MLPRAACISDPLLIWSLIIGNFLVFVAYVRIPLGIWRVVRQVERRGNTIPAFKLGRLFMAFIFGCGLTHLMGAVVFWLALYRVEGGILWFTAVISLFTSQALASRGDAIASTISAALHLQATLERNDDDAA